MAKRKKITKLAPMPNFMIIGAGRTGTTSLYHYLKQHPEIYMSPIKEPRFFIFEGVEKQKIDDKWRDMTITTLEDYQALFAGVTTEKAYGEASVEYLHKEKALVNIKKYIPDAKLIVGLRNPIERVYSHYIFCCREGIEKSSSFNKALQTRKKYYTDGAYYHKHLSRFFANFPEENIHVYLYEDLVSNPQELMKEIFIFLKVNPDIKVSLEKKHNVGQIKKENRLVRMSLSVIKKYTKNHRLQQLSHFLEQNLLTTPQKKPRLDNASKKELIGLYKKDVLRLEKLIGRNLSHWLAY